LNPLRRLAGQTAIYGLPTIVGRVLNYLLVPLYTRVFETAEYGAVTEFYAYVAFLYVLLGYGMETAFFRFSKTTDDDKTVFSTSLISLIISSVIFLVLVTSFSRPIASAMGYASNSEYIRWFALILATDTVCSIPFARLRQLGKASSFAIIKSINITVNIGLNLFFIVLCPLLISRYGDIAFLRMLYKPETGIGYIFISNLIASILTLMFLIPTIKNIRMRFDKALWRQMLLYAWPLLILGLAGMVNETFDRILLKHLLPSDSDPMSQLGIYGACYKISILMTLFIQTYRYAAEPFFFEQMKKKEARQLYAEVMNYFVAACGLIYLSIMLFIDWAILLVGKEFRSGVGVIPILLMANLFLGIFYNLSVWFKITGKTLHGAAIAVFGMIITIVLNFVLIPRMGYMGAAWATLICYGSMMILSYITGQIYYPVPYRIMRITFYILSAALIAATGKLLPGPEIFTGFMGRFLLITAYLGLVLITEKFARKQAIF